MKIDSSENGFNRSEAFQSRRRRQLQLSTLLKSLSASLRRISTRLHRNCRILLVLLMSTATLLVAGRCTEVVYVVTEQGVWIAGDSLRIHSDVDGRETPLSLCKLYISPGRVFFNPGAFRDLAELAKDEVEHPLEDPLQTSRKVLLLLSRNRQGPPSENRPLGAGFVQVRSGQFEAMLFGTDKDQPGVVGWPVYMNVKGVPHGSGPNVDANRDAAFHDPKIAARFLKNPKGELLRMLREASADPKDRVSTPFSVLLLKADGTITDYSDNALCQNPHGLNYPSEVFRIGLTRADLLADFVPGNHFGNQLFLIQVQICAT